MNKMIKNDVPFFYDTKDGTYCYLAVLRMILKYYLPEKDYSWDDLVKLTGKKEGMWTWPQYSYITMMDLGFELRIIDIFDYDEFVKDGVKYIEKEYGKEIAEGQDKHCDLKYEIENIKKLKDNLIEKETRIPNIEDIQDLLSKGFLVECLVNSMVIAGRPGYASHSILIHGFDNDYLFLHDPGFSAGKNCVIKSDVFNKAWAYSTEKMKELQAFKLKKNI